MHLQANLKLKGGTETQLSTEAMPHPFVSFILFPHCAAVELTQLRQDSENC
jgi:hypothetical protein